MVRIRVPAPSYSLDSRKNLVQVPPRLRKTRIDALNTFAINCSFGKDLVQSYVEDRAGENRNARWMEFREVISTPATPHDMLVENGNQAIE